MSDKQTIQIDLVSDVVCPWCVIGYKRLEKALALLPDVQAKINWHPFELNPNMPQGGENLRSHLAAKYGTTLEGSIKARENITALGAELGFSFQYFDDMKMYNTFKAHQLLHYAKLQGKQNELQMRFFTAFFSEGKVMDDDDILINEAESVGLDKQTALAVLQDQGYADAVRKAQQQWRNRGVQAVPTYVFSQTQGITGAQAPEALAEFIQSMNLYNR